MASIIDVYNSFVIGLFSGEKIIIIGGFFLGLSIFSYFYKVNLIYQRQKKIKEIKQSLTLIKLEFMAKITEKSRDELEHEALEFKIEKIAYETKVSNKSLMIQMNSEFEVLNIRLNVVDKLIVRVDKLENDTAFIRDSKRWKWVVGLAFLGLISTVNFEQIKKLFLKFLP